MPSNRREATIATTIIKSPPRGFSTASVLFVLFFSAILQSWLAERLTIWGDESDTMAPAFRVWKGDKDFLWQIGQYNANPPGDNLVLRWFYRSDVLSWLRVDADGLYWRLIYILVYLASAMAIYGLVLRWKRSSVAAAFAALFVASSPMVFRYGIEMRFYIWMVFFMCVAATLALTYFEKPFTEMEKLPVDYVWLCLACSLGALFHLMLVPVGYFVFAYSILALAVWAAPLLAQRRKNELRDPARLAQALLVLFLGSLTFIIYKVEVKHLIFIPHPWPNLDPWHRLFSESWFFFNERISQNLPFSAFWKGGGFNALVLAIALNFAFSIWKRKWGSAISSGFLGAMTVVAPLVQYWNGAARNYPYNANQAIYQAPIVALALIFLFDEAKSYLPKFPLRLTTLSAVSIVLFSVAALFLISGYAYDLKDQSPAKVNYAFHQWREYYRREPGLRQLIVVGAQPGAMAADAGGYIASFLDRYTREFEPIYLSVKGPYDVKSRPVAISKVKQMVAAGNTDFLLIGCDDLKKYFPWLPWNELESYRYPNEKLCHARLRARAATSR